MPDVLLSCNGVSKGFTYFPVPSSLLQDRIVHWKTFRTAKWYQALSNVSFSVERGEWVGIYGPNGSGKTTLLRILANLLPADEGTVACDATLSCFFDLLVGFHPERRAEENAYFHLLLHGISQQEATVLLPKILAFSGLGDKADLPFKCYSQGMKLRLAFSCVVHVESDLYLWDEVTAVGDAAFQKQCREHLRSLRQAGKAGIIVSHSLASLRESCDRIVFLEEGRVVGAERCVGDLSLLKTPQAPSPVG